MSDQGEKAKDMVAFLAGLPEGRSLVARKREGGDVELGVAFPLKEGQDISSIETFTASEPVDGPWREANFFGKPYRASGGGPAMVNSERFKSGWDAVFGAKSAGSSALN